MRHSLGELVATEGGGGGEGGRYQMSGSSDQRGWNMSGRTFSLLRKPVPILPDGVIKTPKNGPAAHPGGGGRPKSSNLVLSQAVQNSSK